MNFAHIHLILNHLPMITLSVALIFLIHSVKNRIPETQKLSYIVLLVGALLVIPVYFTGEPAEEVVEHLPGVSEEVIHPHEEAAEIALVFTVLAGAAAGFALFAGTEGPRAKLARNAVVATSLIALGSLVYTANLGGKVRHTELREATQP